MKTHKITSTKDLKGLFPYLKRTNKFKRALDKIFEQGATLEILEAEPFRCFTGSSGKQFKYKFKANGLSMLAGVNRVEKTNEAEYWIKKNPQSYRNVNLRKGFTITRLHSDGSQTQEESFSCEKDTVSNLRWGLICSIVGKLYKDEFVYKEPCYKCGGEGRIPGFMHVENGLCFKCMGTGGELKLKETINQ